MLKKVTLLLPLTFNDGTVVPEKTLESIRDELFVAFHGWTVAGEVQGAFRMQQTGVKQVDRLLQVWVAVEEAELPRLRDMVSGFGALLGQEAMYFEVSQSMVELIPSRPREDSAHD